MPTAETGVTSAKASVPEGPELVDKGFPVPVSPEG